MARGMNEGKADFYAQQGWGATYQIEDYMRKLSTLFPGVVEQGESFEIEGGSVLELGQYNDRSGNRIVLAAIVADWDESLGWRWAAEWLESSRGDAAVVAWVEPDAKQRTWRWSLLIPSTDVRRIMRYSYVLGTPPAPRTMPTWLRDLQPGGKPPSLDELYRWFDPERPMKELLGPLREEWERLSGQLMLGCCESRPDCAEQAGQQVKQWMLRLVKPFFTGRPADEVRPPGLGERDTLAVKSLLAEFPFQSKEDTPFDRSVAIDPEKLGYVFEHLRLESERKSRGVFYTPREIVDEMCRQCLAAYMARAADMSQGEMLRWLAGEAQLSRDRANEVHKALGTVTVAEPAVGSGAFAVHMVKLIWEVRQRLESPSSVPPGEMLREILEHSLYAVDMDAAAIELVRLRLHLLLKEAIGAEHIIAPVAPNLHLQVGNGLSELWELAFPEVCAPKGESAESGFDIVIGNPPYVDSEAMARDWPELRAFGSSRFVSAKGNWDLYVLFIEQGLKLLRHGGVLSYIVPNKLLSAKYAETIRREMAKEKVVELRDYSRVGVFSQAEVYPIVFRLERCDEVLPVRVVRMSSVIDAAWEEEVDGARFGRDVDWDRYVSGSSDSLRILEKLRAVEGKLGSRFTIKGAATVAEAYRLQEIIRELPAEVQHPDETQGHRLLNTGLIDPYVSLWGMRELRYIKRRYHRPYVRTDELADLSSTRAEEASSAKLIVGGMGLRLEACLDLSGVYVAGKSTSILLGSPEELKVAAALLNSRLMSYFYRHSYSTLAMSGGYLRIGPPQLRELPWVEMTPEVRRELNELVDRLLETEETRHRERYVSEIDHIVYQLFGITDEEAAQMEAE